MQSKCRLTQSSLLRFHCVRRREDFTLSATLLRSSEQPTTTRRISTAQAKLSSLWTPSEAPQFRTTLPASTHSLAYLLLPRSPYCVPPEAAQPSVLTTPTTQWVGLSRLASTSNTPTRWLRAQTRSEERR